MGTAVTIGWSFLALQIVIVIGAFALQLFYGRRKPSP